jgi:DeoR family transcriptional regulator, glycerol-3-phosphate regulon repressor
MFMEERQRIILDILSHEGRVTVIDLAQKMNVSDDTVRRDLNLLSDNGFLQKVHGGAVTLVVSQIERTKRAQVLPQTKANLGKAVADRIQAGQKIILDAGNTTLEVARALGDLQLTIITNSLDIANCLSGRRSIELIVTGGKWDYSQRLLSGSSTIRALKMYKADLAVLGACAIDSKFGVTATHEADAEVKRAIIESSTTKFIVADHTKFDEKELHFVANLEEFDELFTDRPIASLGSRPLVNVVGAEQVRGVHNGQTTK